MQSRLSGAVYLIGAQAVVLVLGYLTHLWIGRILGPSAYGIFGVVLSLQTIFGLFLTLGVPVAIARYVAQDEQHAQSILKQGTRIQLVIATLIALLILLSAPLLSRLLGNSSLTPLIMFIAIVIFTQAQYPIYIQFLSGMHLFNRQAMLTAFYAIIKAVSALSLIYIIHVYGAFSGFAIGGLFAAILGWYWTNNLGGQSIKPLPMRAFLAFAGTYVLILVGLQVLISLDLFMVNALLKDTIATGLYNAAVTLSRISYMLLQGLGFLLLPSVAKITRPGESHHEAVLFIKDTIRYLIALIVPSVALAAATSKPLLILFFSRQYESAAPVLSILMVGLGSFAFYLLLSNIVAGAGKPRISLIITVLLLTLSASLGLLLIPRFGLIGAAWQTTISGLIGLIAISAYTFRTFRIPLPIKSITNIFIATAIAISITYFWSAKPLTLLPQYSIVGLVYLAIMWLLGEIKQVDRQRIANLHPSLKWLATEKNSQGDQL